MSFPLFHIQDNLGKAQVMQHIHEMYRDEYAVVHESQSAGLRRRGGVVEKPVNQTPSTKDALSSKRGKNPRRKKPFRKREPENTAPETPPGTGSGVTRDDEDNTYHIDITV